MYWTYQVAFWINLQAGIHEHFWLSIITFSYCINMLIIMEAADHGLSNTILKHIQEPQKALLRQTRKKWFKLGPTNTIGILEVIITDLVGGWPTPLKNDGVRQLGWFFHSELNGTSMNFIKFHGSSHHQAAKKKSGGAHSFSG